jgi:hypothetical protein
MVFFNSNSGTANTKTVDAQLNNKFGICADVRHFSQLSYKVPTDSHNSQLMLDTDS